MMRYRLLGPTGLRVSELFLGAMRFGGGKATAAECRLMLDLYADAGGNVIDTAVTYGNGDSEQILGGLLQHQRDRFVLATKYTMTRDTHDPNAAGNDRKNLTLSLEQSLRRLRTDYSDLYWVHIWDPLTPVEETLRALDDAVSAGKVLYVGISDAPAWLIARANTLAEWSNWTPFAAVQAPYNLLQRDVERELLPMAEHLRLSVAAWAPLAHGEFARGLPIVGATSANQPCRQPHRNRGLAARPRGAATRRCRSVSSSASQRSSWPAPAPTWTGRRASGSTPRSGTCWLNIAPIAASVESTIVDHYSGSGGNRFDSPLPLQNPHFGIGLPPNFPRSVSQHPDDSP